MLFDAGEPADPELSPEMLREKLNIPDWGDIGAFRDLHVIGLGGVGRVYAADDPVLRRHIALKLLRPEFRYKKSAVDDLIREAMTTAQIDHPNVVPVYSMGVFSDGGVYFTMKRVYGETLASVIRKHADGNEEYLRKYSLRRLLEIFVMVCNGVAFAHSKGIIHRDLKPGNIMLGDYGEVMVMDWGMALYNREHDLGVAGRMMHLMETEKDGPDRIVISGTPAYMSPEQVKGREEELDEATDIYSLGAILYAILTRQPSPFEVSDNTEELLRKVYSGSFVRPCRRAPKLRISRELEAICLKAMARDRADRYATVTELIQDVRNYLDMYPVGVYSSVWLRFYKLCRRHPLIPSTLLGAVLTASSFFLYQTFNDVTLFKAQMRVAESNLGRSEQLFSQATRLYRQIHFPLRRDEAPGGGEESSWLERNFLLQNGKLEYLFSTTMDTLEKADELSRNNPEVRRKSVRLLSLMTEYYIQTGNTDALREMLNRLRGPLARDFRTMIDGNNQLFQRIRLANHGESRVVIEASLPTSVSDRMVLEQGGISAPVQLGKVPLQTTLKQGLHILEAENAAGEPVRVPLEVVTGRTYRINLQLPPRVPEGTVYVPAGEFYSDGDGSRRKRWLPGFLMARHETTIGDYLKFWKTLPKEQRDAFRGRMPASDGWEMVEMWDDDGVLRPPLRMDLPVTGISAAAAEAYCRHLGAAAGMRCRLPTALEFEKASRGADTRRYVWGDEFMPEKALLRGNPRAVEFPAGAPGGAFRDDVSVYGIVDLAGNVREMVLAPDGGTDRVRVMGGSYRTGPYAARSGFAADFNGGAPDIGFRYVMEPARMPEGEKK